VGRDRPPIVHVLYLPASLNLQAAVAAALRDARLAAAFHARLDALRSGVRPSR
jgi:hypothetical protein